MLVRPAWGEAEAEHGIQIVRKATPPGLEPGMRESKSLVLPITPRGKSG
jgi:hypothetical protein